ncbi:MAG: hypothetical protein K2X64_09915 [Rhodocyclaceae bacterium]|nr:hypothetical protein [Rhodocyclaceae bacterium]
MQFSRIGSRLLYSNLNQRMYGLAPSVTCNHRCVSHGKNVALHEVLSIDPDHGAFV